MLRLSAKSDFLVDNRLLISILFYKSSANWLSFYKLSAETDSDGGVRIEVISMTVFRW